jgi:hypothetical protein
MSSVPYRPESSGWNWVATTLPRSSAAMNLIYFVKNTKINKLEVKPGSALGRREVPYSVLRVGRGPVQRARAEAVGVAEVGTAALKQFASLLYVCMRVFVSVASHHVRACVCAIALVRERVRACVRAYLNDYLIPALLRNAHRRRELKDGRACM